MDVESGALDLFLDNELIYFHNQIPPFFFNNLIVKKWHSSSEALPLSLLAHTSRIHPVFRLSPPSFSQPISPDCCHLMSLPSSCHYRNLFIFYPFASSNLPGYFILKPIFSLPPQLWLLHFTSFYAPASLPLYDWVPLFLLMLLHLQLQTSVQQFLLLHTTHYFTNFFALPTPFPLPPDNEQFTANWQGRYSLTSKTKSIKTKLRHI